MVLAEQSPQTKEVLHHGRTLVRKAPVRTAAFTVSELRNQSRFALAVAFAKGLQADLAAYAVYKQAAKIQRSRACDLAVADFQRYRIGQPGQPQSLASATPDNNRFPHDIFNCGATGREDCVSEEYNRRTDAAMKKTIFTNGPGTRTRA